MESMRRRVGLAGLVIVAVILTLTMRPVAQGSSLTILSREGRKRSDQLRYAVATVRRNSESAFFVRRW